MTMTLKFPKSLHLDKNYYRHMTAPFVPCNFGYTNLPLDLINLKIFKMVIVIALPCIFWRIVLPMIIRSTSGVMENY